VVGLTVGLISASASTPAASHTAAARPAGHGSTSSPSKAVPAKAVSSNAVPSKAVPSKAAPSKAAPSKAVLAEKAASAAKVKPQPRQRPVQHAVSNQPYSIYDSVTPSEIPAGQKVATYADGNFAVSPGQVAGRGQVAWIDVSGSDINASAIDVEPGNATPSVAANWALDKLRAQPGGVAWIYTMRSEWPAVQYSVATTVPSSMWSHIHWWIADPTGVPHLVPGSSATQWYWGPNYDISEADQQGL
jgi:hypothetical protein